MNTEEIQKLLPHRYPFLLVDRVMEFEPNTRLVALKSVTINEPFFQGHFPGHPVMPGVLILEALAQACGLLVLKSEPVVQAQRIFYLAGVDGARFRKPVVPGDRLVLKAQLLKKRGPLAKLRGEAEVDGTLVAEGEFTATLVERTG